MVADVLKVQLFRSHIDFVPEQVPRVLKVFLITKLRPYQLHHGQQSFKVDLFLGNGVGLVTNLHIKAIVLDAHFVKSHFKENVRIVFEPLLEDLIGRDLNILPLRPINDNENIQQVNRALVSNTKIPNDWVHVVLLHCVLDCDEELEALVQNGALLGENAA